MASEFEAVANAGTQGGARDAGRLLRALPGALEIACVAAVLVLLWPQFERAAGFGLGRDARFAGGGLEVAGLPPAVLPAVCALAGPLAEPVLVERLCGALPSATDGSAAAPLPEGLPLSVQRTAAATRQALLAPLAEAQQRLDALRARQGDGEADLLAAADAIGVLEARIDPYVARFRLAGDGRGPVPLECALRAVDTALAAADPTPAPARANALLLLGGALDGRPATAALAATAALPLADASAVAGCEGMAASLGAAAAVVGDARQSASAAAKNAAMRDLLGSAGWQWAGAMGLGFAFLRASRGALPALAGVGAALLAWALAGWAARVPWPLAAGREFHPARLDAAWASPPAGFIVGLGAAGLVLLLAALAWRDPAAHRPRQTLSTRVGFAGLAAATGIGWLLLLDLSAHAHPVNRYLALYHQGHLWLGMLVFSVLLFLREPLGRGVGWALSVGGEAGRRLSATTGRGVALALLLGVSVAALITVGLALSNMRQLTSELGRIWLIVGGAWFFFLRGGPLAERMARSGGAAGSFVRYVAPLGFVVAMLLGAMLATRDMGPLLIAGYAAGGFVAATLASWWHQRSGGVVAPSIAALLLFAGWIGGVTLALFQLGNVDAVTAARLESLAAPFASTNDQLALVTWFQHAAPPDGFGLGNAPWCGYAASRGGCSGVPAQVHSDYTFTALVGVFGAAAGWALWLGCALWLHRLVRHHNRVTGGEPRLVASGGRLVYDGQGLLSWVCVGWVVLTLCQLAVTVAGNLAVLPLTGVTFPFVSFGMTSLVVNLAFLALCLNLSVPDRRLPHG